MNIITKSEALKDGYKKYFTGKPCKRGHVAPRKVSDSGCVECGKKKKNDWSIKMADHVKEYSDNYYEKNKLRIRNRHKVRHRNDPRFSIYQGAKRRASLKNLDFNIDLDDIIIPKFCPITNLEIKVGDGKIMNTSPTLDRIDNTKGYVTGNVIVLSYLGNSIKRDLTLEEMVIIGSNMATWAQSFILR